MIDSIQLTQFKYEFVKPTLTNFAIGGSRAINLLTGTALVESRLKYIKQYGTASDNAALGLFQIELSTHDDIWNNYLKARPEIAKKINLTRIMCLSREENLMLNPLYGLLMARVLYLRIPQQLPIAASAKSLATYYKQYYNTGEGAANVDVATQLFQNAIDA